MTVTAGPPDATANVGGFGPACGMIEGLWRGLAAELSPKGVRVIGLRSAGSPDSTDFQAMLAQHAATGANGVHYLRARKQRPDGPPAVGRRGGGGGGDDGVGPGERAHRHVRARDLRLAQRLIRARLLDPATIGSDRVCATRPAHA